MGDNQRELELFLTSVERQALRMAQIATGSTEEALDIVQDAMFGLVRKYAEKPQEQWRPLFFRILQSRIRDWYRRNSVRSRWRVWFTGHGGSEEGGQEDPMAALPDKAGIDPAEQVVGRASMAVLEEALRTLSFRQQQTFLLRAWQGMSVAETAAAMKCSEGTIKTHYARAVKTLRKKLEGHWP